MICDLIHRIKRRLIKLRLQPIRVYCLHQVSETFDESTMKECDWLQTDVFKQRIESLREQGYTFISLEDAYEHISQDVIRTRKFAVLTADDGWASMKNILPWLHEQKIPITLFLNPAYLDGKHYRQKETEKYMTKEEIEHLYMQYPLLTIGTHGWEHKDATRQDLKEFAAGLARSVEYLSKIPNYISYFAYTYGRYNEETDKVVMNMLLVPIYVGGNMNYNNVEHIDRLVLV